MSEFYVKGSFLDERHLLVRYYSITLSLSQRIRALESVRNKLRDFSGFGIEAQVAEINKCCERLKDHKEDILEEYHSIMRIVDNINDYENKAKGILGSITGKYETAEYETTENSSVVKSALDYSSMNKGVLDAICKYGKNTAKIVNGILSGGFDTSKGIPGGLKDVFDNGFGPALNTLGIISNIMDIKSYYDDGKVTGLDIVSTIKDSVSITESALKIYEAAKGVKIFPSLTTAISDTVKVGSGYIGTVTQYLPVANIVLSTAVSGLESYNEAKEDGKITSEERHDIVGYASVDCMIATFEAVFAAVPVVGPIGVGAFEIFNYRQEQKTGKSLKDSLKSGAKKFGNDLGEMIGENIVKTGKQIDKAKKAVNKGLRKLCGIFG